MSKSPKDRLVEMQPSASFFVGIDSDGCVFDSMEIKHKECFCPNTIRHWRLQPVDKFARECIEFVNLYSKWRGANRWPALIKVLDLLRERPEVIARSAEVPELPKIREFIASGLPLSNDGLKKFMAGQDSAELWRALEWSEAVNRSIAEVVFGLPPFPHVRPMLQRLVGTADAIVVSQTPTEALEREWAEHDLTKYVRFIAGQEAGAKKEHLSLAAGPERYARDHVLMIGDALGDLSAAESNNVLFFPVNPAYEDESWEELAGEGLDRFYSGAFAGAYQQKLIDDFKRRLPESAPWRK